MTIFKKKKAGSQSQTKLQKRIASISTSELITWTENALFVVGKEVTAWSRDHSADHLYEADMGAEALYAITQELKARAKNDF